MGYWWCKLRDGGYMVILSNIRHNIFTSFIDTTNNTDPCIHKQCWTEHVAWYKQSFKCIFFWHKLYIFFTTLEVINDISAFFLSTDTFCCWRFFCLIHLNLKLCLKHNSWEVLNIKRKQSFAQTINHIFFLISPLRKGCIQEGPCLPPCPHFPL